MNLSPPDRNERPSGISAESAPRREQEVCTHHQLAFGPSACERCGSFLCESCHFNCAFTSRCPSCFEAELPVEDENPTTASQVVLRHFNMGVAFALVLGGFLSLVVSYEEGPLVAAKYFGMSFIFCLALAQLRAFFVWLNMFFRRPTRLRRLRASRAAAVSLLATHCRFLSDSAGTLRAGHCSRCDARYSIGMDSLCKSCVGLVVGARERFERRPVGLDSPPPWSRNTRLLIGVYLAWLLTTDLILWALPLPTRRLFSQRRYVPIVLILCSLYLAYLLYARIRDNPARDPWPERELEGPIGASNEFNN